MARRLQADRTRWTPPLRHSRSSDDAVGASAAPVPVIGSKRTKPIAVQLDLAGNIAQYFQDEIQTRLSAQPQPTAKAKAWAVANVEAYEWGDYIPLQDGVDANWAGDRHDAAEQGAIAKGRVRARSASQKQPRKVDQQRPHSGGIPSAKSNVSLRCGYNREYTMIESNGGTGGSNNGVPEYGTQVGAHMQQFLGGISRRSPPQLPVEDESEDCSRSAPRPRDTVSDETCGVPGHRHLSRPKHLSCIDFQLAGLDPVVKDRAFGMAKARPCDGS
jgi:hypothetical protein